MGRIKGDLLRVGNTRRDWCSGRAWWLGARGGGVPGRERTYHLRRRCPMVKREAGMEEEDEGAVVHDFRAQARARASPSSTELWHSTERVHLTRASWARQSTPRTWQVSIIWVKGKVVSLSCQAGWLEVCIGGLEPTLRAWKDGGEECSMGALARCRALSATGGLEQAYTIFLGCTWLATTNLLVSVANTWS